MEDAIEFSHPSYGMVGFSRTSMGGSGRKLFGSALRTGNVISLRITKAVRKHELGRDWYFGGRKELIEVMLTESQFVALITQLNQGDGVPCTLSHIVGERIEEEKDTPPSEVELIHNTFRDQTKSVAAKLKDTVNTLKTIADETKMSATARDKMYKAMAAFEMEITSNLPFLVESLNEAGEKLVDQAKHEIVAFTEGELRKAGLEAKRKEAPLLDHNMEPK